MRHNYLDETIERHKANLTAGQQSALRQKATQLSIMNAPTRIKLQSSAVRGVRSKNETLSNYGLARSLNRGASSGLDVKARRTPEFDSSMNQLHAYEGAQIAQQGAAYAQQTIAAREKAAREAARRARARAKAAAEQRQKALTDSLKANVASGAMDKREAQYIASLASSGDYEKASSRYNNYSSIRESNQRTETARYLASDLKNSGIDKRAGEYIVGQALQGNLNRAYTGYRVANIDAAKNLSARTQAALSAGEITRAQAQSVSAAIANNNFTGAAEALRQYSQQHAADQTWINMPRAEFNRQLTEAKQELDELSSELSRARTDRNWITGETRAELQQRYADAQQKYNELSDIQLMREEDMVSKFSALDTKSLDEYRKTLEKEAYDLRAAGYKNQEVDHDRVQEIAEQLGMIDRARSVVNSRERLQEYVALQSVTENADFAARAQIGSTIKGNTMHQLMTHGVTPEMEAYAAQNNARGARVRSEIESVGLMTDTEKAAYNYYLSQSQEAADEYMSKLETYINERRMQQIEQIANTRITKEDGTPSWIGGVTQSLASVIATPFEVLGAAYSGIQHLTGNEIDPNHEAFTFSIYKSSVRGGVGKQIAQGVYDAEGGEFLAQVATATYQSIMSMCDNLLLVGIGGTLGAGASTAAKSKAITETYTLLSMSSAAAATTVREAMASGATQDQAMTLGIAAGAFEAIFERAPLENWLNMPKDAAANTIQRLLKQAGLEASEEIGTEIAGIFTNIAVMGDQSEYEQAIRDYRNGGATMAEARSMALIDLLANIGFAAYGGFVSGFLMGGMGSFRANQAFSARGAQLRQALGVKTILEEAQTVNDAQVQKLYAKMNNAFRENAKVRDLDIGRLDALANEARVESFEQEIDAMVDDGRITAKQAREIKTNPELATEYGYEPMFENAEAAQASTENTTTLQTQEEQDGLQVPYSQRGRVYDDSGVGTESRNVQESSSDNGRGTAAQSTAYAGTVVDDERRARTEESGTDQADTGKTAVTAWDPDDDQNLTRAVFDFNAQTGRKDRTDSVVESVRPENIDAETQAAVSTAMGIAKSDVHFYRFKGESNGMYGFSVRGRAYASYVEGNVTENVFQAGHETAETIKAYRNAGETALDMLGSQRQAAIDKYIEQRGGTGDAKEFVCDMFGAYLVKKATGTDVYAQVLGEYNEDTIDAFELAFAEAVESYDGTVAAETNEKTEFSKTRATKGYDFSKPFEQQVDDWVNNKFPKGDVLVMGGTPKVYQNIGLTALPMVVDQTHMDYWINHTYVDQNGNHTKDHDTTEAEVKMFPQKIGEPIIVIASRTPNTRTKESSVVALVELEINGKQSIAPIRISSIENIGGDKNDVNKVASVYGANVRSLLEDAFDQYKKGNKTVYYLDKKRTATLIHKLGGLQLPSILANADGYIHNIAEGGSSVKVSPKKQTETQQFVRWFKNSKAVNADGTPLRLYHNTNASFTVFDTTLSGKNQGDTLGDGIYMSSSPTAFAGSEYGTNQMQLYATIQRPFDIQRGFSKSQANRVVEKYGSIKHDIHAFDDTYKKHAISKLTNPLRVMDYIKEYARDAGIKTSDIFKELGYDGIRNGNEWVAFDNTQVKSATDNRGTFDGSNPDINFSTRRITDPLADQMYDMRKQGQQNAKAAETAKQRAERILAQQQDNALANQMADMRKQGQQHLAEMDRLRVQQVRETMRLKKQAETDIRKLNQQHARDMQRQERAHNRAINKLANEYVRDVDRLETSVEKKNAKIAEQKETMKRMKVAERIKVQETRERANERHNKEKSLRVAKNSIKALEKMLVSPNKDAHVPTFMRSAVAELVNLVDIGHSPNAVSRGGKEYKGTNEVQRWRLAVSGLRDALAGTESTNVSPEFEQLKAALPENFVEDISTFISVMTNNEVQYLADMSSAELRELNRIISTVRGAVAGVNRLYSSIRYKTVEDLGAKTIADSKGKIASGKSVLDGAKKFFKSQMIDFFSWGHTVGDSGDAVTEMISDGYFNNTVNRVRETQEFMESLYKKYKFTNKDATKWGEETHSIDLARGETINLTTTEIMELYALSFRTQAIRHILYGGIKSGTKGNDTAHPYKITENDLDPMFELLSNEQKSIIDEMQEFMSTTVSSWGNEVTQRLYMYDAFNEDYYWTIRSAEESHDTKDPDKARAFNAILNSSFTKQLTPNATSPIQIGDAFSTFVDHCSQMANYNGLAVPLQDTLKWLNYKARNDDGTVNHDATVKTALNRIGSKEAETYIVEFIKDLNGINSKSRTIALAEKLTANAKRAAIAAKVRVVIQQPTSVIRATAMIDPKYFATTKQFGVKRAVKEMQTYAPIAWWKSNGNYEIGLGQSMRGMIMGDATDFETVNNLLMKPTGLADDLGWSWIWNAVKQETKDTTKLKPNSPEFFEHCAKRFTDVCNATQVIDTPLHRSEIMRSKDSGVKQLTAFMSEPAKNYNIMYRAVLDAARKKPGATKKLGRTLGAVIAAQMVNSLVTALWDSARKRGDDDEETFRKLFGKTWVSNFISGINPLSNMPFFSDIWDMGVGVVQGRENVPNRMDMDSVNSAMKAVESFFTTVFNHDESRYTTYYAVTNLAKQVSNIFGLPVNGIISSAEGIVDIAFPGLIRRYKPQMEEEWQQEMYDAAMASGMKPRDFYALYEDLGGSDLKTADKANILANADVTTEQKVIMAKRASDSMSNRLAEMERRKSSDAEKEHFIAWYGKFNALESTHDSPKTAQLRQLLLADDSMTAEEKTKLYNAITNDNFGAVETKIFQNEDLSEAEKNALYSALNDVEEMERILADSDLDREAQIDILDLAEGGFGTQFDFTSQERLTLSSRNETTYHRALSAERAGVSNATYLKYDDIRLQYERDDSGLGKSDVLYALLKDKSLTKKQKAALEKAMYETATGEYEYIPADYSDEAHFYITYEERTTLYPMKLELAERQGFDYGKVTEYVKRYQHMKATKTGSGSNGGVKKRDSLGIMEEMGFNKAEQKQLYEIMTTREVDLRRILGK